MVDALQLIPEETDKTLALNKPVEAGKTGARTELKKLEADLKKLLENAPPRPLAMSVREAAKIEDCHILIRGNIHNRGEKVARGFLQVATYQETGRSIPDKVSGRQELAAWLTSPSNPLTARVMANRVWHYLIGAGLVRTVDVFGTTGEPPSHPELLDHLAIQFVQDGWSVKKLIRAIMLSHAYQLGSEAAGPQGRLGAKADPENRLLWHMNRRRLDAETIRDSILSVSGRLDLTLGGPMIRKGATAEIGYQFDDNRRSVYTPVFRNRLLELFEAFDFADPNLVMGRRNVSTVATQALFLMNNRFVMEQAGIAAQAALAAPGLDDAARAERAYRTTLGRQPTERERELARKFLASPGDHPTAEERLASWERFYQALFACIDFRYVN